MQLNISTKFFPILEIISEKEVDKLNKFLKFNEGSRISCNDLANKLGISFADSKEIIYILLKNNVIEINFKVKCYDEYKTSKPIYYDAFEDIPDEVCDNCEKKCEILRNVIIVYKIINGDLQSE
ncbi:hypothetical protein DVV81_08100 [Clostridium botulinum]|uniref:hypothetical protein n=1 Tax=Clostridium botulinum TaxID=1491 RepID=UPI0019684846|nr:hypothetical protein [Clostridium botulinum]MBN1071130.1 hypothetical protein [Clostridium botulinum]